MTLSCPRCSAAPVPEAQRTRGYADNARIQDRGVGAAEEQRHLGQRSMIEMDGQRVGVTLTITIAVILPIRVRQF